MNDQQKPFRHRATPADLPSGHIGVAGDVLTMSGDIDAAAVRSFRSSHPHTPMISTVEASDVTFLSSAGVAYLIALIKAAAPQRVSVLAPTRSFQRTIEIVGLDTLLDLTS